MSHVVKQCQGVQRNGERCENDAKEGERFCSQHRKDFIASLSRRGAFGYVPSFFHGKPRGPDQREAIRETRHGVDRPAEHDDAYGDLESQAG